MTLTFNEVIVTKLELNLSNPNILSENISNTEIGIRFRSIREKNKLTQGELAKHLNVSASSISQIEKGKMALSVSLIVRLISLYGVSFEYLIMGIDQESKETVKENPETISHLKQTIKALEASNLDKQKLIDVYEKQMDK